jgi:hypothetical protein
MRADIPAKLIVPASVGTVNARANHDRTGTNHNRTGTNHDRATSGIDHTPSSSKHVQSANTGKRNCKELGPNKLEGVHGSLIKSG